jgi:hypothetical protein
VRRYSEFDSRVTCPTVYQSWDGYIRIYSSKVPDGVVTVRVCLDGIFTLKMASFDPTLVQTTRISKSMSLLICKTAPFE